MRRSRKILQEVFALHQEALIKFQELSHASQQNSLEQDYHIVYEAFLRKRLEDAGSLLNRAEQLINALPS